MNQITPWPPSPPGCAPCFDPAALLQCWCDIQATTAVINQIVLEQIQTNPAYAQAIAAALVQSGSTLPLVGVTNGTDAQPGQVGEFFTSQVSLPYTAAQSVQTATMGVLQPGDWDCWAYCLYTTGLASGQFQLSPVPAGFSNTLFSAIEATGGATEGIVLVSSTARALISVPVLVSFLMTTNYTGPGPSAGTLYMNFNARRRR